ncbi:MAG: MoaD/ThiS family protein [Pseudomonadota bacterium]
MKITFKLYASLAKYLPREAHRNQIAVDVEQGATVADIIARFNVPEKSAHLVLVNGVFVPPDARLSQTLTAGDTLAIWPPVAGG